MKEMPTEPSTSSTQVFLPSWNDTIVFFLDDFSDSSKRQKVYIYSKHNVQAALEEKCHLYTSSRSEAS
jgi:hypothetical protein